MAGSFIWWAVFSLVSTSLLYLSDSGFAKGSDRGAGTGGAGGAIAPPIFLEIGEIIAFSSPNNFRSK